MNMNCNEINTDSRKEISSVEKRETNSDKNGMIISEVVKKDKNNKASNAFNEKDENINDNLSNSSNEKYNQKKLLNEIDDIIITDEYTEIGLKRFKEIISVGCECIKKEELLKKVHLDRRLICYDGFEPSGRMHIAQGLLKSLIVNKLTENNCTFIFWIADWFAQLNNKMSSNLKRIQTVGKYFIEVWKACGMKMEYVKFLWASEEINKRPDEYWSLVMDISRCFNINRIKRCLKIMGRHNDEENYASQIIYPCMQCADIFFLKVDICQLGVDQRKVNMLAREYCDIKKIKHKPVILSHEMLPGLLEGQEKMSKSNEESSIYMDDTEIEVNKKIKKSFCPPNVIEKNPIYAYAKHIIFPTCGKFELIRKEENGGNKTYYDMQLLESDYIKGEIHPKDLKDNVAIQLNKLLQPVRKHFQENPQAKALLKEVKMYKVTK